MLSRLITTCCLAMVTAMLAPVEAAHAAHPLQTEDSSTQGEGNLEIENGLAWARAGVARQFSYQPQASFGITSAFDVVMQPSWVSNRDDAIAGQRARGLGDTNLDVKWRFFGSDPYALAIRAGALAATGGGDRGIGHGRVGAHALLVGTLELTPVTLHGNLGIARVPGAATDRKNIGHVSAAAMWSVDERLVLTVDAGAESDPDMTRNAWPATVLVGAVYTIRPGLDIDAGFQKSAGNVVSVRKWLLGLTWRFAP